MEKDIILDEQEEISHKINLGKAIYSYQGITFSTFFTRKTFLLKWEDCSFCSLTPFFKKENDEWKDYEGNGLRDLTYLEIKIALKSYSKTLTNSHALKRIYLGVILNLKPLDEEIDNITVLTKGVITMNVNLESLTIEREAFIEFLSNRSDFNLIISF